MSVPDPELLQGELDEADQTAGRGKTPPKRVSGPTSPGVTSEFSGNTARISGSAPSWADSDPAEDFVQDISKNADYSERAIDATGAQVRPFFQALSGPIDTTLREIDAPQLPKSNFFAFTSSKTRYVICCHDSRLALLVYLPPKNLTHTKIDVQIQFAQDNSRGSELSEATKS